MNFKVDLGGRLRRLRTAKGLSLEQVAAEMDNPVTKQALSKYETGKAAPARLVLAALAKVFKVKTSYFFEEPSFEIKFIAYRKSAGLGLAERERIENAVRLELEERIKIQDIICSGPAVKITIGKFEIDSLAGAEEAAKEFRKKLNLGVASVARVTDVLEDCRIHAVAIDADEKFDGLSAYAVDRRNAVIAAAVVSRKNVAGERQRLNLMHETGHLLLSPAPGVDAEKAAFRFASAFLAPAETIIKETGARRSFISTEELFILKKMFGMSVQAILYRLRDLEVITASHYKNWCVKINRLKWKKNEPHRMPFERSRWMDLNVLRAYSEGLIGRDEAIRLIGREAGLEEKPSVNRQCRDFMNKSPKERRESLARQAEKLAAHYEGLSDDLETGDAVEY
jgi:transcriptional regulator with XRE-family HTH domain